MGVLQQSETHAIKCAINNYATRAFRDIADQDYIAARFSFRAGLVPQYLTSSTQCIEKYLKAILLLNRVKATKVQHNINACMVKAEELPFSIQLKQRHLDFIERLTQNTPSRYFEKSHHVQPYELWDLDSTVWHIRRYCRVLDHVIEAEKGKIEALPLELASLIRAEKKPMAHRIIGGKLEKIIEKKDDSARPMLIWKNLYFGSRNRSTIAPGRQCMRTRYSPTSSRPEIIPFLSHYIYLDKQTKSSSKPCLTSSK
jgi:HEPN domain-containing protein